MRRGVLPALLLAVAALLPAAPASAAGHLVRITSTLSPSSLTVEAGDTVTWRNDDAERHRIRSQRGPIEFDSGNLEPGQSFRVTFAALGVSTYADERDDDDPRYWGTVTVVERGGGEPGSSGDPTATARPVTPGPTSAPVAVSIGMADRVFRPANVTIAAGGSITWRNDDDRTHTATSRSGVWDSGDLEPQATYRRTFPAAGTFPFLCVLHPEMTGTVTVVGGPGAGSGGTGGTGGAGPSPAPTGGPPPTPSAPPTGGSGDPAAPAPASVSIADFSFGTPLVEVGAGAVVTWRNDDIAPHTVTAGDGAFDSGRLDPGASYSRRFGDAGRFAYLCELHPSMTGVVVVRPSPAGPDASVPGATASQAPEPSTHPEPTPASGTAAPLDGATLGGGPAGPVGAVGHPSGPDPARSGAAVRGDTPARWLGSVLLGVAALAFIGLLAGVTVSSLRGRRRDGLLP